MPKHDSPHFRRVQMATERSPFDQRGGPGDAGHEPGDKQRERLRDDAVAKLDGSLQRQGKLAGLLLRCDESNDDEGKKQRRREIVHAERRDDDSLEWTESL